VRDPSTWLPDQLIRVVDGYLAASFGGLNDPDALFQQEPPAGEVREAILDECEREGIETTRWAENQDGLYEGWAVEPDGGVLIWSLSGPFFTLFASGPRVDELGKVFRRHGLIEITEPQYGLETGLVHPMLGRQATLYEALFSEYGPLP
jgi:hypothetical protein